MDADVRKERGGLVMRASVGAAGRGALGTGAGTGGRIYDLRWNAETFALEMQRTAGGAWEVLLQFENYYFPNELT